MSDVANVITLATKTLPKTNFDKMLDGIITMLPAVTTAIAIKFVFRSNRV